MVDQARQKLSVRDLIAIHRDHYAGMPYDTAEGLAAGPYGDVDRLKLAGAGAKLGGSWERTISLFRTPYCL